MNNHLPFSKEEGKIILTAEKRSRGLGERRRAFEG
jgi:hypothetical protein